MTRIHRLITSLTAACLGCGISVAHADPWQTITPGGATGCADGSPYAFHVRHADPERIWQQWALPDALRSMLGSEVDMQTVTSLQDFYTLAAKLEPRIRFHLYDAAYDAIQERFLELLGDPRELYPDLQANLSRLHAALPYLRSYTAGGEFHTLLRFDDLYVRKTQGVKALDWVSHLIDGQEVQDVHCGDAETCRERVDGGSKAKPD